MAAAAHHYGDRTARHRQLLLFGGGRGDVAIPEVSGQTEAAARAELEAAGLQVADEVEEIEDDEVEAGNVVKTDPPEGNEVKEFRRDSLHQ